MLEPVRKESYRFAMANLFYADAGHRSNFRLLLCLSLLTSGVSLADAPRFSSGGFNFQIQYGPGFWLVDKNQLGADEGKDGLRVGPDDAALFANSLQNTHTVSFGIGYTILGHVSLGADLTATGWDLSREGRGGAGLVIGKVAWHPLELFFMKKDKRPIPLDFSTSFGLGYGIVGGGTAVPGRPLGMDGLIFQWGAQVDYYFARFFGVGLFARGNFLNWDKFYLDYNNRDVAGNTIPLAKPLGGAFWTMGLTLTFRAGE
jgi:hypothetical protein